MYLVQTTIYQYVLCMHRYIPGCTLLNSALQDFLEPSVMETCQMLGIRLLQILALKTRVVTMPPVLKMKIFKIRQDAETMEEAINKFMDGMEDQEHCGFKDMHCFLKLLPVPTAKTGQTMTHTDVLEGNFLPSMTNKEQKQFTPS
jgi:hypothetical protein